MLSSSAKKYLQDAKNLFWHLPKSVFFSLINGFPSRRLILIGVTGTDGKTTVSSLIYHTLTAAGIKAGLISTIEAKIGSQTQTTGLHTTSPNPAILQKIFRLMIKQGVTHVVCEVTSHALDQNRFWGCHFKSSLITNTSHEHLDYHQSMADYIKAKTKLFKQSSQAVLNKDDPSYSVIKKKCHCPVTSYSIDKSSPYQAKKIKIDSRLLQFQVNGLRLTTDSPYHYQIYNILASLATIIKLGIDPAILIKTIKKFPDIKGRRELIPNNLAIKTIIDFAHTPAALKATLYSLKKTGHGRLIVIFGATGGRDQSKRPEMGRVVSQYANIAIITADDTRNEKVADINRQIKSGIKTRNSKEINNHHPGKKQIQKIHKLSKRQFIYFDIPQRQSAFNLAIKLAKKGDTVIACGKGHETTILHGHTDYPWSEAEAFRSAFRQK